MLFCVCTESGALIWKGNVPMNMPAHISSPSLRTCLCACLNHLGRNHYAKVYTYTSADACAQVRGHAAYVCAHRHMHIFVCMSTQVSIRISPNRYIDPKEEVARIWLAEAMRIADVVPTVEEAHTCLHIHASVCMCGSASLFRIVCTPAFVFAHEHFDAHTYAHARTRGSCLQKTVHKRYVRAPAHQGARAHTVDH